MSCKRAIRLAGVAAVLLMVAGFLVVAGRSSGRRVEIRGTLSPDDLAGVIRAHREKCPAAWPFMRKTWFPVSFRQHISAQLNPIEVIAVPSEGQAIVVYRGFNKLHYDKQGEHRWGAECYTLSRSTNGWY